MKKYLLPALVGYLLSGANVQAQSLTWSVVNRFPLVSDTEFQGLSTSWDTGEAGKPKNMHDFIVKLMKEKESQSREQYLLADAEKARGRVKSSLKDPVTVKLTLGDPVSGTPAKGCTWTTLPGAAKPPAAGDCTALIPVTPGVPTKVEVRDGSGKTYASDVLTKDILIVAMGDSYASGEGSPDRPAIYHYLDAPYKGDDWFLYAHSPTPPVWLDPVCHRSMLSWPVLAALQLALVHKDVTVRLINTTCSGAAFYDGLLNAQVKDIGEPHPFPFAKSTDPDDNLVAELTPYMDGEGRRTLGQSPSALYVRRSQVNQVREALCNPTTIRDDVSVANQPYSATWQHCQDNARAPDALLLTAGGNDVGFGPAVGGVLFPSKGRSLVGQIFLSATRSGLKLINPDELADKAQDFSEYYPAFLSRTIEGALSTPEKTVLMTYPNPVGAPTKDCFSETHQKRMQSAYKAFGAMVGSQTFGIGSGWDIDLTQKEVSSFSEKAYPAVQAMIRTGDAVKIDWLASARGDGGKLAYGYDNRLLCTYASKYEDLEPVYFCNAVGNDKCEAKPLSGWNSEIDGRKIVNSTNDALLAQRTWNSNPSRNALFRAAAGTFHPNAEAHAVAADSAYAGLCEVLKKEHQVCGVQ